MSIDARIKSNRGRPKVDTEEIRSRVSRELLLSMDEWIATQPEPRPSRPQAIRQLLKLGIDASIPSAPTLNDQIARQEETIARRVPTKKSPKKGMAILRKGLAEIDLGCVVI